MRTIYRAPYSTNCERVALAMGVKGIAVDDEVVISYDDRSQVEAVSGQGLVPVLVDGERVIADSQRIMRELESLAPEPVLFPDDEGRAARLRVFCEWFDAVWKREPNLLEAELRAESPDELRVARLGGVIAERLDLFEQMLACGPFLLGQELSAADLVAFPFLKYARGREPEDPDLFHRVIDEHQPLGPRHVRLRRWLALIDELPRAFGP